MNHLISVNKRSIEITEAPAIVRDGVNVDTLSVTLDEEWEAMETKYLVFENGNTLKQIPYFDTVTIPWETLQESGYLNVTVVGYVGNEQRLVTKRMGRPFKIERSGACVGEPDLEPTPDAVQEILSIANEAKSIAQGARDEIDNSMETMKQYVDEQLGVIENGSY